MTDPTEPAEPTAKPAAKKRGRKKGSRNKPKPVADLAQIEQDLLPEREQAEEGLRLVHAVPLTTPEHRANLADTIKGVRAYLDELEAKRTAITKPLLEAKRAVDALFKPITDCYKAIDRAASERLGQAVQEQRELQERAVEAVGQGARDDATLAVAHDSGETPAGLAEHETYEFEIVDASAIPRPFLAFDESLARSYAKAKAKTGELREDMIPGVKITRKLGFRRVGGGK